MSGSQPVAADALRIVCTREDEALLRERLGQFEPVGVPEEGIYLAFEDGVLQLQRVADRYGVFVTEAEIARRLTGQFLLGRACGLPAAGVRILDAMGGLGVDALALARKGASVKVIEREPVLWALLQDLIRRVGAPDITAVLGDCRAVLAGDPAYDVVYLDPMFPERRKKALPGKRMQYVGALLAQSDRQEQALDPDLVALARSRARSRVVLKRRLKDPVEGTPDWTLKGRSVRYDMYTGFAED